MTNREISAALRAASVSHWIDDNRVWVEVGSWVHVPFQLRSRVFVEMTVADFVQLFAVGERLQEMSDEIDHLRSVMPRAKHREAIDALGIAFDNYLAKIGKSWHDADLGDLDPIRDAIYDLENI